MQACHLCGICFEMEFVPANPFRRCPNPACRAPLDADAVEHTFVEAGNPSDVKDTQRAAQREQLHADVERHEKAAEAAKAARSVYPTTDPVYLTTDRADTADGA